MTAKRKPVEWKYPSEELLKTKMPWDTPEYREHLEAIGAWGEKDYKPEPCEGCHHMNDFPECPTSCNYQLRHRLITMYGMVASCSQEYWDQSIEVLEEFIDWLLKHNKLQPLEESKT